MRAIPGLPDYWATDEGHIVSTVKTLPRVLRPAGNPYLHVYTKGGKYFDVQILVCLAYHGLKPTPEHEVNHKNRDKKDNRPSNLEWVTPKENIEHVNALGITNQGARHGMSKLTDDLVRQIRIRVTQTKYYIVAREFGVSPGLVSQIARRIIWKHVGDDNAES